VSSQLLNVNAQALHKRKSCRSLTKVGYAPGLACTGKVRSETLRTLVRGLLHFHHVHFSLSWFFFRLRHQLVVPVRKFCTTCRCIMIQVYKLKKLNSVLNSEINIGVFVGHIHLNKFLIKLFLTRDKWVGVKLYSCLMVTVYTYKFIS
jgi:hypothetical protein